MQMRQSILKSTKKGALQGAGLGAIFFIPLLLAIMLDGLNDKKKLLVLMFKLFSLETAMGAFIGLVNCILNKFEDNLQTPPLVFQMHTLMRYRQIMARPKIEEKENEVAIGLSR